MRTLAPEALNSTQLGDVTTLDWDHRNRLVKQTYSSWDGAGGSASREVEFYYDVFNHLIGKRVAVDSAAPGRVGDVEFYAYDGGGSRVLTFQIESGTTVSQLAARGFYSATGQVYAVDAHPKVGETVEPLSTHWLVVDRQGNVAESYRFGFDANGQVAAYSFVHLDYTAWGAPSVNQPGGHEQLFGVDPNLLGRFQGSSYDGDLAAYQFGDRWQSPALGRWLSEDPSGLRYGTNPYEALRNSPYNYADPSGHVIEPITAAIYVGWTALSSALDTAAEATFTYAAAWWTGDAADWDQFSVTATYGKHFGVNLVTAGLGSKLKWGGKGAQFVFRKTVETFGDTAVDTLVYDKAFGSSLLANTIGNLGGEALGWGVRFAGRHTAELFGNNPRLNPFNYRHSFDRSGVIAGSGSADLARLRAEYDPGQWKFMTRGKGFDRQLAVTGNRTRVVNGRRQIEEYVLDNKHFDDFDIQAGVLREVKDDYDFAFDPDKMLSWRNGQRAFLNWARREQNDALKSLDIAKKHGFTYEYLVDPRHLKQWEAVLDQAMQEGLVVKAW